MAGRIAILGASIGGLVAAAELRQHGCEVTMFEKGKAVGGLYSKAATPFGTQELGMHVLYVNERHFAHLCAIFGEDSFHVMHGTRVDVGASANFGQVHFGSHYPSLLEHPLREQVLREMLQSPPLGGVATDAHQEAMRRFGPKAATEVIAPILRKLWNQEPDDLSPHALHCFFDLRRMVVAGKAEADRLKDDPALDRVVANPDQGRPKGQVFGGRMALVFRAGRDDLSERAQEWASRQGVTLRFGSTVAVHGAQLRVDGTALGDGFDACIVALPASALAGAVASAADKLELSIFYFQLEAPLGDQFPAYYILAHDAGLRSSRIVHYDGYRPSGEGAASGVLAVESVHPMGNAPSQEELAVEITRILPCACVKEAFRLPRSLPVFSPTLANGRLFDAFESSVAASFGKPVYFTGVRTDTGVFFSHHTIGLAHDSALACLRRLA